ncbi:thioester reductase-like protein [Anaerobacterium chartisolvens]|uniref:Phenolphthiocerol/phthiocerol polyketide synthase subunit E n=1 Tax=Anaerobacterium chartisolvens TaxID=1297424 RepID=A0A369BH94_9FIRM|nr:type I polyketide synthase [Anaerobacterium chartisolvens]RCX20929.1 thioester reductase-like protein [Anaerobacterium chartisolvens]
METYKTLIDALKAKCDSFSNDNGILFINGSKDEKFLSYERLYKNACDLSKKLRSLGLKQKDELVFQMSDNETFLTVLWACFVAGIIPVPVAIGTNIETRQKVFNIWEYLNNPYLIIDGNVLSKLKINFDYQIDRIQERILITKDVLSLSNFQDTDIEHEHEAPNSDDIAFIQFSSGSTGEPKGVILTHKNLLTNIRSIIKRSNITKDDSTLSWMPLTHDMGMIGSHLTSLTMGINLYLMPTELFIKHPLLWLEKASEYGATLLSSPNFGYKYYLKSIMRNKPENLDLSCVRLIFNGAEPISKALCDEFIQEMSKYKLKRTSMFTVYGLAEASLAVTFPHPEEEMVSVIVDRNSLSIDKKVEYCSQSEYFSTVLLMLGSPVENTKVRIVDIKGDELPQGYVGHIEICGNNVTSGYYNNKAATDELISEGGWLNTGDIGFLKGGCLAVTGRAKDIIFMNGQNFYSHDLERIGEEIEGVELGKIAAIGSHNDKTGEDDIVLFVVYKTKDLNRFLNISLQLKEKISSRVGLKVSHVIPVKNMPKTTSGKIQRYKLEDNYKKSIYDNIIKELEKVAAETYSQRYSSMQYKTQIKETISRDIIINLIQDQIEKVLGFRIIDPNKSLMEAGIDSIKVPQLQILLEDIFRLSLPVTLAFDYPTLNKMADYIYRVVKKENEKAGTKNHTAINGGYEGFDRRIAIVGMGCRFPGGAVNPESFWEMLENGKDAIDIIPPERWKVEEFYNPSSGIPGKMYTKSGGFLDQVDKFDAAFFGIAPIEAEKIDPQQRLLLEVSYEALENAGQNIDELEGSKTGVFIGISSSDYSEQTISDNLSEIEGYSLTGSMLNVASGRISYAFGFNGPSMSIDTACSSSLVAIKQALTSLYTGECDMALAGGVNLMLSPKSHIGLSRLKALSPDGRCKTFDDSADGYGRSEGCGIIVLKRLNDALRDRDNILGVILGGTVNHDGRSSGLTVPNGLAQESVIKDAITKAGIHTSDVDYIEAHGTGTKLGDPQEVNALANVFSHGRPEDRKLLIGSVKTNIGHLESAAGIAGVIKVVLALNHEVIPKHIHFNKPNRLIKWEELPIKVTDHNVGWKRGDKPRIAGVSSFGLSGTNSHIIIQEAPLIESKKQEEMPLSNYVLTFSAKKEDAIKEYAKRFKEYLMSSSESIEDICYTSNICKTSCNVRFAAVGKSKEDFVKKIDSFISGGILNSYNSKPVNKVAFMFTGQGSQYIGVGQELYKTQHTFRETMDTCCRLFNKYLDKSIIDILYFPNDTDEILEMTEYSQPIIFSVEYSLLKLWESCNVKPSLVVGHSIGKYTAACAAGILSMEDTVKLVASRGKLMQVLHDNVCHSNLRRLIIKEFEETASGISCNPPKIPIIADATGKLVSANELSVPEYWTNHILDTVHFHDVLNTIEEQGCEVLLEMGSISTLSGIDGECIKNDKTVVLPSMSYNRNDLEQMLETTSKLYMAGINIDWKQFSKGYERKKVILPNYPFQRKRYWKVVNNIVLHGKQLAGHDNVENSEVHCLFSENVGVKMIEDIQLKIKEIIKSVSGIEVSDIDENANLFSLGLDSLMLIQIKKQLDNEYKTDISVDKFLEDLDTVQKISAYISANGSFKSTLCSMEEVSFTDSVEVLPVEIGKSAVPHSQYKHSTVTNVQDVLYKHKEEVASEIKPLKSANMVENIMSMQMHTLSQSISDLAAKQLQMLRGIQTISFDNIEEETNVNPIIKKEDSSDKKESVHKTRPEHLKPNIRSIKLEEDVLSLHQERFVKDLIYRYNKRTQKSKKYEEKSRYSFSHWLTSLNFRMTLKELIYPLIAKSAKGAYFWDIDGNKYIDLAIGYGVHFFGHKPEFVTTAIENQIKEGFVLSPHPDMIGEVADLVREITGVERVNFCNTGSEAVMAALRIARTVTKRSKVVRFAGSYHGIYDGILAEADDYGTFPQSSGIMQGAVDDIVVLGYGSPESLKTIREMGSELAAVLVEPVQSRRPGLQPKEFLQELREITEQTGTVLIFDEMITGFRICAEGAQKHFGTKADIVTYGKIVGGGMPIGVVAGKKEYLDAVDGGQWNFRDKSAPDKEVTFIAGTFANHPLTLAASRAVLEHMKKYGSSLYDRLNEKTTWFADTLNRFFEAENIPIRIRHFGSLFRFESFGRYDLALMPIEMDLFFYLLMEKGIYTWERRVCFFSTAHTDEDFDYIIKSVKDSLRELRAGGFPFEAPKAKTGINGAAVSHGNNDFPLSTAQKRYFVLSKISKDENAAHLPYPIIINGPLDISKVEEAFKALVKRHEGLRTSFGIKDSEMVQYIHENLDFKIQFKKGYNNSTVDEILKGLMKPFDIEKAPLINVSITEIAPMRYLLFMDFHHIIADGFSANIVARDFVKLYNGVALSPIKMQYRDYVYWMKNYTLSRTFENQEKYWLEKFSGELPVLDLPIDHMRPAVRTIGGNTFSFILDKQKTEALKNLAKSTDTSLYMVLIAAYNILLSKLSGQNDIIIGTPVAVRWQGEFDDTVGMFTNTLVLRNNPEPNKTFTRFLAEVKENSLQAYANSEYPFEELAQKINVNTEQNRNPLFDAMFIYENANDRVVKIDNLTFNAYDFDFKVSLFDFTFEALEAEGEIQVNWYYNTDLFESETINKWKTYFDILFAQLIDNKEADISSFLKHQEEELKLAAENSRNKFKTDNQGIAHFTESVEEYIKSEADNKYQVYLSEKEKKIVEIFKDVLNVNIVGVNANFFEMGGRSLTAVTLIEKMQKDFNVNIMDLFKYPTISQLAKNILYKNDIFNISEQCSGSSFTQTEKEAGRSSANISNQADNSRKINDIAVIGISAKLPGAKDINEFWNNLKKGKETISFFTDEELLEDGIDPKLLKNPNYIKAKGVLDDLEYFDASFFDYSPKEAELMEPQIRVFHECAWKALEDAGYNPETYDGPIGVYAGSAHNFSWVLRVFNSNNSAAEQIEKVTLNDKDFLSTRISYKFNLRGPSFTVQTACSSSLVAVHLACQALLNGECSMALAGGVSVMLPKKSGYLYNEGMISSPDGHCRPFDAEAEGTIFSDGVGIVVLKPLEDAIADGDNIYAVIKGTAINNDGIRKVGYTAPSIQGQSEVVKAAQRAAGVDPETITYIETHGTGTNIGDPIEIEALMNAFNSEKKGFCAIGSVKSNVGHLDAAAGVVGLIKTVIALKKKLIPPTLHFKMPNPKIGFESSPFYVNSELKEWQGSPLRAGVSSFGFGGTNAHVVLEEAPMDIRGQTKESNDDPKLLVLSAKTKSSLERATENLAKYLNQNKFLNLNDVAYTLQVGRKPFKHRRMLVCSNIDEAVEILSSANDMQSQVSQKVYTYFAKDEVAQTIFMFTGQGSQYVNMGLDLYEKIPDFRKEMDRCLNLIKEITNYDVRSILYPEEVTAKKKEIINQTYITQLVIFSFEYSLASLLIKWGIRPNAMIGHSIGEYVAACISGAISLKDSLTLVAKRGRLMQEMYTGSMLSVVITEEELKLLINDNISVAAVNGPSNCVVSGEHEVIDGFEKLLEQKGHKFRRLKTSHAFHSRMMEAALQRLEDEVRKLKFSQPLIPYVSNINGKWAEYEEISKPEYWSRHLRDTVRFSDGLSLLLDEPNSVLIEVGAGKTLSTFARRNSNKKGEQTVVNLVRHPEEAAHDVEYLLNRIGILWCAGININWKQLYSGQRRMRVSLPTYPFNAQKFRIDGMPIDVAGIMDTSKKMDFSDWFYTPTWKTCELQSNVKKISKSNWMLFADRCGLINDIVDCLQSDGHNITVVRIGTEFKKLDDGVYTIDPEQASHYKVLLNELKKSDGMPEHIVHAWNVCDNRGADSSAYSEFSDVKLPFFSIMYLTQAIGDICDSQKIRMLILSNNMQRVTEAECIYPQKSMIIGLCKNIPQEYMNICCRSIDTGKVEKAKHLRTKLVQLVYDEIISKVTDILVAYRGGLRFVEAYDCIEMDRNSVADKRLKDKGVYLITGGTGGIGLVIAEYLAEKVQGKLILTGRTPMPDKSLWKSWLTEHDEHDETSQKIRKIHKLEELGSEILVVAADVADYEQMKRALKEAEEKIGAVNGIIHAAGVSGIGPIQSKTKESVYKVFESKVIGTLNLNNLMAERKMDFFIICSSMASIVSAAGQSDYASANAFIDGFVKYKNLEANETFTACINWDSWSGAGMTVKAAKQYDYLSLDKELETAISPEEGKLAFEKVLGGLETQILVTTKSLWAQIEKIYRSSDLVRIISEGDQNPQEHSRPELSVEYAAPTNEAEEKLACMWAEVLGIGQIGIYDNFSELGGDSLTAIALMSKIQKEFAVDITEIFEYPTIAELAKRISTNSNSLKSRIEEAKLELRNYHERQDYTMVSLKTDWDEYLQKCNHYSKINIEEIMNYKNVLLLGSTGYLGIYLLKELLDNTSANIYTVIRAESLKKAVKRLNDKMSFYFGDDVFDKYKNRIKVLKGEISEENFGLNTEEYHELTNTVDCVINSAAKVAHYGKYEEFYKINVEAVSRVIDFARIGLQKDIHHISTKAVSLGKIDGKDSAMFTEYDFDLGQRIKNYYVETKKKAELLIVQARKTGINANIYRVGDIAFDSRNGKFQENIEQNFVYLLIRSLISIGYAPELDMEFFDFAFVDYVSKAVVMLLTRKILKNEVFHIVNPIKVSLKEFLDAAPHMGVELRGLELNRFMDYLFENYDNDEIKTYIEDFIIHSHVLESKEHTSFVFGTKKTTDLLGNMGFVWTKPTRNQLKMMFEYGKRVGFFK